MWALYQYHYNISRWPGSTSVTEQISNAVVRILDPRKKYDGIIESRQHPESMAREADQEGKEGQSLPWVGSS